MRDRLAPRHLKSIQHPLKAAEQKGPQGSSGRLVISDGFIESDSSVLTHVTVMQSTGLLGISRKILKGHSG